MLFLCLLIKTGFLNCSPDQTSSGGKQIDFGLSVLMRLSVLDIDHPDHLILRQDGNGKECLIPVFGKIMEELKPGVAAGVLGNSHRPSLFCHPASNTLAQL